MQGCINKSALKVAALQASVNVTMLFKIMICYWFTFKMSQTFFGKAADLSRRNRSGTKTTSIYSCFITQTFRPIPIRKLLFV